MSNLSSFFGQHERSKGAELVRKNLVMISTASDTNVSAFVRGSSAYRIRLIAADVASPTVASNCSCPQSRKGVLCKHIWAVLLKLEEKSADFLEGKSAILVAVKSNSPTRESHQDKAEAQKIQQRQKIKDRNREIRNQKKRDARNSPTKYPAAVEDSIRYFSANGFPFEQLEMNSLLQARKILSRVFHPDKGGTHAEILELNIHFERLENHLKS